MRALTAAAIQVAPVRGSLTPQVVEANIARCIDFVRRCVAETGAELVVLPESATTGSPPTAPWRTSGISSASCPDR